LVAFQMVTHHRSCPEEACNTAAHTQTGAREACREERASAARTALPLAVRRQHQPRICHWCPEHQANYLNHRSGPPVANTTHNSELQWACRRSCTTT
jgi:hypothetical protein